MSCLADVFSGPHGLLFIPGVPGGLEVLIILVVILLLFGGRIPGVARSLGRGITEFKRGIKERPTEDAEPPRQIEGRGADPGSRPIEDRDRARVHEEDPRA